MKERITVTTQAELTAVTSAGNIAVCVSGKFIATGSAHVVARGSAHVVARDSAHVEAWDSAHVVAKGSAHVEAWDSAHVEAWDSAHVEAWGNVFVRLFSAFKIEASAHVVILEHGNAASIKGGQRLKAHKPNTAKDWCSHWGVTVKKSVAILFKGVNDDFSSPKGADYTPGTQPQAPDWDNGVQECGGGLHFSPSPRMTLAFHSSAKRFLACPVALKDIAVHPDGHFPEKVKAKGCCAPVWEVDKEGNKL